MGCAVFNCVSQNHPSSARQFQLPPPARNRKSDGEIGRETGLQKATPTLTPKSPRNAVKGPRTLQNPKPYPGPLYKRERREERRGEGRERREGRGGAWERSVPGFRGWRESDAASPKGRVRLGGEKTVKLPRNPITTKKSYPGTNPKIPKSQTKSYPVCYMNPTILVEKRRGIKEEHEIPIPNTPTLLASMLAFLSPVPYSPVIPFTLPHL